MKERVFFIFLASTKETQKFKEGIIISAYYRLIMYPYLNFTASRPHHIVTCFTTAGQVHVDLQ